MERLKTFATNHPQIASWVVLAIGMVIILIWAARDVGFTAGQWLAMVITTILLAGASVWILGWGNEDETEATDEAE